MELDIDLGEIQKTFDRMADNLLMSSTRSELYKVSSFMMHKIVISHFEKEIGPGGDRWARFKYPDGTTGEKRLPYYVNGQRRPSGSKVTWKNGKIVGISGNTGTKPLSRDGVLKNSINPKSTNESAEVVTRLEYAGFHDNGTRTIPKREYMYLEDSDLGEIAGSMASIIVRDMLK